MAIENVVNFWSFLPVRTSASLPRKPMRVALFWYMIVSPFLNSRSCSGHTGRSLASGSDSQVPSSAFTEGPSKMETVTRRAA